MIDKYEKWRETTAATLLLVRINTVQHYFLTGAFLLSIAVSQSDLPRRELEEVFLSS